VTSTVIFDWYGTLALPAAGDLEMYSPVFRRFGIDVPVETFARHTERWQGVDHHEHSATEASYDRWTRGRVLDLVMESGADEDIQLELVDALLDSESPEMAPYEDAVPVLEEPLLTRPVRGDLLELELASRTSCGALRPPSLCRPGTHVCPPWLPQSPPLDISSGAQRA
jgi:hypothetical protein